MPPIDLKNIHIDQFFNTKLVLLISLIGGVILTALMYLSHLDHNWVLDSDFHPVLTLSVNLLLLFTLLSYNFAVIKKSNSVRRKYFWCIVGSLLIAVLFTLVSMLLHHWIYEELQLPDYISINLLKDMSIAIVTIFITLALFNLSRRQQMSLENERLKNENLMVRYETLETQIDPHFLFNSLNTLSGLIGQDDERAQQYLQKLASTYRYIMRGHRLVTLEDELQFVESYCTMMQIRYGDNLVIERHIDPGRMNYGIIPISIQLLIENALKHNVVSDRYPLTITIATTDHNTILVTNPIRPKQEAAQGNGLGLVNLGKRYQLLCGQDIAISRTDGFFKVEVPLLTPEFTQKFLSEDNGRDMKGNGGGQWGKRREQARRLIRK